MTIEVKLWNGEKASLNPEQVQAAVKTPVYRPDPDRYKGCYSVFMIGDPPDEPWIVTADSYYLIQAVSSGLALPDSALRAALNTTTFILETAIRNRRVLDSDHVTVLLRTNKAMLEQTDTQHLTLDDGFMTWLLEWASHEAWGPYLRARIEEKFPHLIPEPGQ